LVRRRFARDTGAIHRRDSMACSGLEAANPSGNVNGHRGKAEEARRDVIKNVRPAQAVLSYRLTGQTRQGNIARPCGQVNHRARGTPRRVGERSGEAANHGAKQDSKEQRHRALQRRRRHDPRTTWPTASPARPIARPAAGQVDPQHDRGQAPTTCARGDCGHKPNTCTW
jgi:hypothetical protein